MKTVAALGCIQFSTENLSRSVRKFLYFLDDSFSRKLLYTANKYKFIY
ncbi:hypothetical protein J502_2622 [Acinetobacter sp. 1294596]|nr:hypothetical protein J502_2622 [Acinetobacter sp. 1294596]